MLRFLALCLVVGSVVGAPGPKFRRFIETFGFDIETIFDLDTLYCDVQILLDVVGTDPVESACEEECRKILTEGTTLVYGCPLLCHGLQDLAQYFHEEPKPGDENQPCGGDNILDVFGKRK